MSGQPTEEKGKTALSQDNANKRRYVILILALPPQLSRFHCGGWYSHMFILYTVSQATMKQWPQIFSELWQNPYFKPWRTGTQCDIKLKCIHLYIQEQICGFYCRRDVNRGLSIHCVTTLIKFTPDLTPHLGYDNCVFRLVFDGCCGINSSPTSYPYPFHYYTRYLFPVLVARGIPRGVGFDSDMKVMDCCTCTECG